MGGLNDRDEIFPKPFLGRQCRDPCRQQSIIQYLGLLVLVLLLESLSVLVSVPLQHKETRREAKSDKYFV